MTGESMRGGDDVRSTHVTPAGLLGMERTSLRKVAVLYIILAGIALAVPAALAQPRGESPHHISETSRR